jgi:aspartyl-tRNA(Asn)/glutamyl-tRNA(Gln) amidotransferase subunit A
MRSRGSAPLPDPADLGLRAATAAIAVGQLSAAELADACLARAEATATLGAFATLDADGGRRGAAERDRAAGAGRHLPPLHGAPVGIKDIIDVAALPTRAGSSATAAGPAPGDASIVTRLREAGTVVLGKTATHEFAYGVTTRATRNPWDFERLAGGSSGGSAVAVAAGACPLAVGSDTAGSCRIPAALCGVAGMMARPGRLPMDGVVALAPGLDTLGLLARTAGDLALAWTGIGGGAIAPAGALRVGTAPEAALGAIDPDALEATEQAAGLLASAGGRRATVDVPAFDDFSRPRGTVIAALALEQHLRRGWWPRLAERYGEDVAADLRRAEPLDPDAVAAAGRRLQALAAELRAALDAVDVLVLPTTPGPAPLRDTGEPVARQDRRHAAELTRLCGPVNAAGLAAVSVFAVLGAARLPLGAQFVARDEATALAAAVAHEALSGEPPRPPLLTGAAEAHQRSGGSP